MQHNRPWRNPSMPQRVAQTVAQIAGSYRLSPGHAECWYRSAAGKLEDSKERQQDRRRQSGREFYMKLHQRGIDLLLNVQDAILYLDKLSAQDIPG